MDEQSIFRTIKQAEAAMGRTGGSRCAGSLNYFSFQDIVQDIDVPELTMYSSSCELTLDWNNMLTRLFGREKTLMTLIQRDVNSC